MNLTRKDAHVMLPRCRVASFLQHRRSQIEDPTPIPYLEICENGVVHMGFFWEEIWKMLAVGEVRNEGSSFIGERTLILL